MKCPNCQTGNLDGADFCFKCDLVVYGGYGNANIIKKFFPFMRAKGMTKEQIHALLVDNSRRLLEFEVIT